MSDVSAPASTATPVSTPLVEPIEVNGGDSVVTFDDLERVEAQAKSAKRAQKDQVKETVKETVKAMEKGSEKDEKSKDSPKKADDKEADNKEEAGKKEAKPKVDKQAEKDKKLVKAKVGEKEIDLDLDTVFTLPVDGKEIPVTLRDLQNEFNGKTAWEKRFSELNKERQTFQSKVEGANQKIKTIFEEQDPEMRFFHMAEFAGKDPVEVRAKFLEDNIKLLEKYYSMSDDERKADMKDFENKVLKHRLESKQKEDTRRQSETALQSKIADLGKTHQFSEDEFWNQYDQLKTLKAEGKFQGKITPDFIAETLHKERLWKSAAEVLDNSDSSNLPLEKRNAALFDLVETCALQGLGPKEVQEIADEMWGRKAKTSVVEEKIKQNEELRTGKREGKKPEYKPDNEATFFDDL